MHVMQFHHIRKLAAHQHGVVSSQQLHTGGLSAKQIFVLQRDGLLVRARQGAYRIAGAPDGWEQRVSAALLVVRDAALSRRSAARIWGISHHDWGGCEIVVPSGLPRRRGMSAHVDPNMSVRVRNDLRVTSVETTIVDLAAVASQKALANAIDEALRLDLTTLARICDAFGQRANRGVRGIGKLRKILARLTRDPAELKLELERRTWRWLRRSNLQPPEWQRHFVINGKSRYADFLWDAQRLIVEPDGRVFHDNARSFHDDRKRDLEFASIGYETWHITWETDESMFIAALAARLSRTVTPAEAQNSRKLA
jgi:very-short-patch-repair endonuclease